MKTWLMKIFQPEEYGRRFRPCITCQRFHHRDGQDLCVRESTPYANLITGTMEERIEERLAVPERAFGPCGPTGCNWTPKVTPDPMIMHTFAVDRLHDGTFSDIYPVTYKLQYIVGEENE